MGKTIRADSTKIQAKVLWAIISDPLASQRTLAKKAWVSKTSIQRHTKELDQTGPLKIKAIEDIIQKDVDIVNVWQDIILKRMIDTPDKVSTRDIINASDTSAKRYALFKWKATDEEWGLEHAIIITWMNSMN